MALLDGRCSCRSCTPDVGHHVVAAVCLACCGIATVTLEATEPVRVERVRPTMLTVLFAFQLSVFTISALIVCHR